MTDIKDRFLNAKTPADMLLVTLGLIGEKATTSEIISGAIDAKVSNDQIPIGTDRESVKSGINSLIESFLNKL